MELLLTCNSGLEFLLKKEIEKFWYKITKTSDRLVYFQWDEKAIVRLNLWSRVWNKLFLLLQKKVVNSFEDLFQLVNNIDWKNFIKKDQPIIVQSQSIKSKLSSVPSIQSITKKAIVKKIVWWEWNLYEDNSNMSIEILVVIDKDIAYILLNTSWAWLHQRGYRLYNYDAPIKENLAAWIIWCANWRYSTSFVDAFCGSWTFLIEATMIAKNIAPWLKRTFAFESFDWISPDILTKEKQSAIDQILIEKQHEILGFDNNSKALEISKQNAINAWVDKYIRFEKKAFEDIDQEFFENKTLVCNPPYGLRLNDVFLGDLYDDLIKVFETTSWIQWWFITWYEPAHKMIDPNIRKLRKLYNWWQKCYFFKIIK